MLRRKESKGRPHSGGGLFEGPRIKARCPLLDLLRNHPQGDPRRSRESGTEQMRSAANRLKSQTAKRTASTACQAEVSPRSTRQV